MISGVKDGQLFDQPVPYQLAGLIDPSTNKPTSVKIGYLEDGSKVRVSLSTGTVIPFPNYDHLKYENKYQNKPEGPLDTSVNLVHKLTY